MTHNLIESIIKSFDLNENQRKAAEERGKDIILTAGAGSGKTMTLVARYTTLLAEGIPPRRIAAITFTKKAAREMRSRVRAKVMALQQTTEDAQEQQKWSALASQMDSARIGTIHSLCSEILRNHPAEAGIDPAFEVIDEGLGAALKQEAVENTLSLLVEQAEFAPLLYNLKVKDLNILLSDLLKNRLDAREAFEVQLDPEALLLQALQERMSHPLIKEIITDLRSVSHYELMEDAGDKLTLMIEELLALWAEAETLMVQGDLVGCAQKLFEARRNKMMLNIGKKTSEYKEALRELRNHFKTMINPITGGEDSDDTIPDEATNTLFKEILPLLKEAFEAVQNAYQEKLAERQALDFDDLEYGALQLLRNDTIKSYWQNELDAILVDEFQDTNQRQQEIIEALTGRAGSLFIVGDMKQSIYRFRQADVTVFKKVQEQICRNAGLSLDLALTYRTHEPLLLTMGDILANAIGTEQEGRPDYYVPYTEMCADKKTAPDNLKPPHVEFIFGIGEKSDTAREAGAHALVERLLQLKMDGQITKWNEVALLFRSAYAYSEYEEALEDAGVPFVSVAGKGFYERGEIRDLLNILCALADPEDDLAFAGLLRSPAFGLSDAALYLLRQKGKSYWQVVQEDCSCLDENDHGKAQRALEILQHLLPMVDRVPVGELIKAVIDTLHYRAILASVDTKQDGQEAAGTGGRLYRNLDKLLDDAYATDQISLRNYLESIKTLNDAGAREGEAPAEAEGSVQLMTIHKAKGLEFEVVVLAGAGRGKKTDSELVYTSKELGVSLKLDPAPMFYKLAKQMDEDQDEMEELRVLYVALTRAKHKFIISGDAKSWESGKLTFNNWAKKLAEAVGLDASLTSEEIGKVITTDTSRGYPVRVWCVGEGYTSTTKAETTFEEKTPEGTPLRPLYQPILEPSTATGDEEETQAWDPSEWIVSGGESKVQGKMVGNIIHKAIALRLLPEDPKFKAFIESALIHAGVVSEAQREYASLRANELLERLRRTALWEAVDKSSVRYHEVPYAYQVNGRTENRVIDLLYEDENGWHIVDFKSDQIDSYLEKERLISDYKHQVKRYQAAVRALLGVYADTRLCFLDDQGQVSLVEI